MLRALITQSFRNLLRNKFFSLINIAGLSTAMVVAILIGQYARFELSYDSFHPEAENIYRVTTQVALQNKIIHNAANTYQGIVGALPYDFPEIAASTSIAGFDSDNRFLQYLDEKNELHQLDNFHGFFIDSSLLKVFAFPLAAGDRSTLFTELHTAIVSERWARNYLGSNLVGKFLVLNDGTTITHYKITGVLKDIPANAHFKFDLLLYDRATPGSYDEKKDFWMWAGPTYIVAHEGTDISLLQERLTSLAQTKMGLKINKNDYGQTSSFTLQPLLDIHLHSHLEEEIGEGGSAAMVYTLLSLACLILIIAWVNYVNLATSMSFAKVKGVAIRKIVGASRTGSMIQVLTESAMFNFLSLAIAIVSATILLPDFKEFVGMPSGVNSDFDWLMCISLLSFCVLSTAISGLYPAVVISSSPPSQALKGISSAHNGTFFRKSLVTFQFSMAIMIMIAMVICNGQLSFMRSKDLGIDVSKVLVVKALNFNKEYWSNEKGGYRVDPAYERRSVLFKDEIKMQAGFSNATSLSHLPGSLTNWGTEFKMESIDERKAFRLHAIGIDFDFMETLGVRMMAGRNFSATSATDRGNERQRSIIINETASKLIGFKSPQEAISKHITTFWGADYEIIGVMNSFHWLSPKDELEPIYLILQPRALTYFAIKFQEQNTTSIVGRIGEIWKRHFPELPFNYFFLDEHFARQYDQDRKLNAAVEVMTTLTLLIAGLGLFGLTSYAIVRRTREIGIRKVMGASVANVIALFTHSLLKLIVLAGIVTLPFAFWGASWWLEKYAFRISLQWWHFTAPLAFVLFAAFVATVLQTVGIASRNPTQSLRSE